MERIEKLRDYEALGVPEVWELYPEAGTVEVLQLQDGKVQTVQVLTQGQVSPAHFLGVAVEVSSIWPE